MGLCGLILVGDFVALGIVGDALGGTYLFVTSNTVFYSLSWLNLMPEWLSFQYYCGEWSAAEGKVATVSKSAEAGT